MFKSQSSASVVEPGKTWGIWSVVGAWGVAAVIAAMIPVVLTLLYRHLGIQSRDVEYIFFGILAKPLHGTPLVFLRAASIVYWELGLILLAVAIARDTRWRRLVALLFPTLSIALLFYVVPLLSVAWSLAWKNGCIPTGPWGYNEGKHGPWRHLDPLGPSWGGQWFCHSSRFWLHCPECSSLRARMLRWRWLSARMRCCS